ncbi:cell wall-binding repeat-containing protein [Clostridium bovifaecis]|uniref:Cell wall-binding repeat-containing protein n=1 Tax=Clostridium bovifaecis TaxID=2184719 RepID=A0A6I6EWB2_9CLOT|nr:cell wall-binding repeat-containing protein [Clostridium bovifaecis]
MITNELLKKRFKVVLIVEGILALVILYLFMFYQPNYTNIKVNSSEAFEKSIVTGNTTRIYGKNFYETAIAISQAAYPATFEDNKPNAVILVNGEEKNDGILSARLIDHPINGPILYAEKESIPKVTLDEIKRLNPKGIFADRKNQVILVGNIGDKVESQLNNEGIKFRHLIGNDPFELGRKIDDYLATLKGNHKDSVIIAPIEMSDYALSETAWSANTGDGFLFITKNSLPKSTEEALKSRHGKAYMYLLGNDKFISKDTKKELLKYGHLQKIPGGKDVYAQAVGFANYNDIGKNFGWWINKRFRRFGWGITEAGHNFIFVNPKDWHSAVASSTLTHKGNHGPILLVEKDSIPDSVKEYLEVVKPIDTYGQGQLYNHGWIIGTEDMISTKVQADLDNFLSYEEED